MPRGDEQLDELSHGRQTAAQVHLGMVGLKRRGKILAKAANRPGAGRRLDQTSIRWNHLIEDNLIYLNNLEQPIRIQLDVGCSK
jgi:hypothetical protein